MYYIKGDHFCVSGKWIFLILCTNCSAFLMAYSELKSNKFLSDSIRRCCDVRNHRAHGMMFKPNMGMMLPLYGWKEIVENGSAVERGGRASEDITNSLRICLLLFMRVSQSQVNGVASETRHASDSEKQDTDGK